MPPIPTARPAGTTTILPPTLQDGPFSGCVCATDGVSGGTSTDGQGCASRTDSGFLLPISMCYVVNPSRCPTAFASTNYPGASWQLC